MICGNRLFNRKSAIENRKLEIVSSSRDNPVQLLLNPSRNLPRYTVPDRQLVDPDDRGNFCCRPNDHAFVEVAELRFLDRGLRTGNVEGPANMKNDLPGNTRQNEVGFSRGKEHAAFESAEICVRAFRDEAVTRPDCLAGALFNGILP